MSRRYPPVAPDALVATCPPAVRELATAVRQIVREAVPAATEIGHPGWRTVNFRDGSQFAYLCLYSDRVHLGFDLGVLLDDPAGLLQGTAKRARYVVLRNPVDLDAQAAGVRALIEQAHGLLRRTPGR